MRTDSPAPVTPGRVLRLWSPLALSWLFMALEQPFVTGAVARMPDERVQLAAFGGVAFPVALVIEGPIIMLLAASTALVRNWADYRQLRRLVHLAGAALTLIHAALAFTPLYDLTVVRLLGAPPEIIEPGRLALQWMLPWTWAIAWRRYLQGILIRAERGKAVTAGTVVRLVVDVLALGIGWQLKLPGAALAGMILSSGVVAEALYISWSVRPVLREMERAHQPGDKPIRVGKFLRFYVPLALTPLIALMLQPIGAAAISRMPNALDSLAALPVVHSVVFLMRSLGMAFNEVVVSLIGAPGSVAMLRLFSRRLALVSVSVLLLIAATPLADLYFQNLMQFSPWLTAIGVLGLTASIFMPANQALQSLYMGCLVARHETRGITESVVLYFALTAAFLWVGIQLQIGPGLPVALTCLVLAGLCQTLFLAWRAAPSLREFEREEAHA